MTTFRNDAKGRRGILLKGGSYAFIDPGRTATVPSDRIRGVPGGLVEVDAESAEAAPAPELAAPPADLAGQMEPVEGVAAQVLVTVEDFDGTPGYVVSAPWLDESETYADQDVAGARQLELREAGPPEGWEPSADPFDHDGDGKPGGSLKDDPPSLSNMTVAQLTEQAGKEGVDVASIKGIGILGRVKADDIRNAIEGKREAEAADYQS